ncbi:unnamed protein product, partial [Mycena citricolor]
RSREQNPKLGMRRHAHNRSIATWALAQSKAPLAKKAKIMCGVETIATKGKGKAGRGNGKK